LGDDPEFWDAYGESLTDQIMSNTNYADLEIGPQLLAVRIRTYGRSTLPWLIGLRPAATNADGETVVVRHNYAEGLTPEEMNACVVGARKGLARVGRRWDEMGQEARERGRSQSFHVLARARRAKRPGIVFARAASTGETDPLTDIDSRLFVGLAADEHG
jgi:hypothetical protein